ncbi:PREDICTED: carboxypeptidase B-like [Rhagoletis zephyria]|uniref:carboxypeptidase B-like n=1 Tax=Rhagoletis zephyria TaxID=28612 RepID=UPI0008119DA8|nr:PREDICTED: carboxypeptidase B-like [Rhagoletis zephyria]
MAQLLYLQTLSETSATGAQINFWSEPNRLNSSVDFMVAPEYETEIKAILKKQNMETETLINDVGRILGKQKEGDGSSLLYLAPNETSFFQKYQPLSNIYQYIEEISRQHPDLCSLETIGKTSEGRVMKIIKVGYSNSSKPNKPIVWIDAGIHAREWIAPATAIYIINKLVNNEDDNDIVDLLHEFDFHILPSANPDGYEYSRNFDRFWRKTRSRNRNSLLGSLFCIGVDPNRNYGWQWKKAGSSNNPCSNTYHGPFPFSEPETKAIGEHVLKHKDRVKLFVSLHSYSQLILTPWGWTKDLPKAYPDLMRVAQIGSRAIKMRYGTEYEYGTSPSILYWAHGAAEIKYAYTFELRDKGSYGFLLPARFIKPTGEETVDALVAMLTEIKKEIA